MKLALFEIDSEEKKFISPQLKKHEAVYFNRPLEEGDLEKIKDTEGLVIFIYTQLTKEIIDRLPNLKFVVTCSTGFDHIDLEACKERNIVVTNVPSYGEITVAEHTFALILALSRRILESNKRIHDGYFSPEGLTGFDLNGKTLGVIGVGSIGCNVSKIANGFGMKVLAYKRSPDPELEKEYGFTIVDLETVLQKSDIVTIHLPYNQETHHLIDQEKFYMMKKGSILINTARGAIVDTKAMVAALQEERLFGVGLDVFEGEPVLREEKELLSRQFNNEDMLYVLEEHLLLHHPHVVMTPHNAFNSREALEIIMSTAVENISAFEDGKPQNVVEK